MPEKVVVPERLTKPIQAWAMPRQLDKDLKTKIHPNIRKRLYDSYVKTKLLMDRPQEKL